MKITYFTCTWILFRYHSKLQSPTRPRSCDRWSGQIRSSLGPNGCRNEWANIMECSKRDEFVPRRCIKQIHVKRAFSGIS